MNKAPSLSLCIVLLFFLQISAKAQPSRPIVGAIRWDAWFGQNASAPSGDLAWIGPMVESDLGPSKYHFRAPFFSTEINEDSVQIEGNSSTVMTQEIAYAKYAGIDYWAFVYYPDGSGADYARNLYNANPNKNDVKACYILDGNFPFDSVHVAWLVERFTEANYQTVLTGRPLLYILPQYNSAPPFSLAQINSLRNIAVENGSAQPYIVVMGSTDQANQINADAVSAYASSGNYNGVTYAPAIPNADYNGWNELAATGKKVIPWVTTGWMPQPRIDNINCPWNTSYPSSASAGYPDPSQLAQNLQTAFNWIGQNATVAETHTLIMYAWNEHDEGGWICPTITVGNNSVPDSTRIKAIRSVTIPSGAINIALNSQYSASSSWDTTQTAGFAFDGDNGTEWQSASGSFTGQWLEVNFGHPVIFDSVRLSEYGDRTSGFLIEYSNDGIVWDTAYSGTTIGLGSTFTFPPVMGRMARIFFTNGQATPIIFEFSIYLSPPATPGNSVFLDGGFESPSVGVAGIQSDPSATPWQFAAESGIQNNGSDFSGLQTAPEGVQTAWLQGISGFGQTINFSEGGTYAISFQAAKRANWGGSQTFTVSIDANLLGTYTPSSGTFQFYSAPAFTITAGLHTIYFSGSAVGDNTDLIDDVRVSAMPVVNDGGFESPALDSAGVQANPSGTVWQYTGGSGIQNNGSAFSGSQIAPDGVQTAYLQGISGISQTMNVAETGVYAIGFWAAKRANWGNAQTFTVSIDTNLLGTYSPSSGTFGYYATSGVNLSAGSHTIYFSAANSGDNTDLIDAVGIIPGNISMSSFYGMPLPAQHEAAIIDTVDGNDLIYPNPAQDQVHIMLASGHEKAVVQLLTIEGRLLEQSVSGDNGRHFNVGSLARGIYMIKVMYSSGKTYIYKILLR
ncbi:MAG TPA: discoidin domain-containing protein [Puia sp.]|jgi:hypothetical protein